MILEQPLNTLEACGLSECDAHRQFFSELREQDRVMRCSVTSHGCAWVQQLSGLS
jgi:hypothetical protein